MVERNRPHGLREWLFAGGLTFLAALGVKLLFVLWAFAALITSMQLNQATVMHQQQQDVLDRKSDEAAMASSFNAQVAGIDRRVTALEVARAAEDKQQVDTAAAISGLQAQSNAIERAVSDLGDLMRTIESQLADVVRAANAPLPGPRRR